MIIFGINMRKFKTGATRNTDNNKYDYEGFLNPLVLHRFAEYMHHHRKQADGTLRDSDNWQKGIPQDAYMKSMFRHFMDLWMLHRSNADNLENPEGEMVDKEEILSALMFNVMGYLLEEIKKKNGK